MTAIAASTSAAPRPITLTTFDHRRLERLVAALRERPRGGSFNLDAVEDELDRAELVEPAAVPADVITMNSRVLIVDLATGDETEVTLVFPAAGDARHGHISVLAPLGVALLGARTGDVIDWPTAHGVRRVRVARVLFQPEAAGRFDL